MGPWSPQNAGARPYLASRPPAFRLDWARTWNRGRALNSNHYSKSCDTRHGRLLWRDKFSISYICKFELPHHRLRILISYFLWIEIYSKRRWMLNGSGDSFEIFEHFINLFINACFYGPNISVLSRPTCVVSQTTHAEYSANVILTCLPYIADLKDNDWSRARQRIQLPRGNRSQAATHRQWLSLHISPRRSQKTASSKTRFAVQANLEMEKILNTDFDTDTSDASTHRCRRNGKTLRDV